MPSGDSPDAALSGLVHLRWEDDASPDPTTVARRLRAEGVEPAAWSNGPGDRYGRHAHGSTKVLMCAAGSITFLVGEQGVELELRPGEGFVLPAGVEHSAVVGPEGCTCLEGHR
jgi:quercetin dioxygenase-like cupin family protein